MIGVWWAVVLLAAAVVLLGLAPAAPRHATALHYLAAVVGAVVGLLALLRLIEVG